MGAWLLAAACASKASPSPGDIAAQIDAGQFQAASDAIQSDIARIPAAEDRLALEFQRERMRRILLDFPLSEADVKAQLRKDISDLRDEEFAAWDAAGQIEHLDIDGHRLYFHLAAPNLFRVSPQATARRRSPPQWHDGPLERPNPHHREVITAARTTGATSVAPRYVRVTQGILVKGDAVPAGQVLRVWIPYPRAIRGQQEAIKLIRTTPAAATVAPESALQRTVYLEAAARAGEATRFSITYELTVFAQYHSIDASKVVPTPDDAHLAPFLGERPPHIVFSEDLRAFSRKVVGDERNPYRIAQKLFDAVDLTPWAGAREYSTLSNISDYALHAGHADCGQQTLLLMTLLRLNGIPARWQSGMIFSDGEYNNLHDWGQLYLAPYGWVPMDVTFGRLHDADPAVDDFYLGGLDAYRIAFNDDYGQPLVPAKQHFRSETVDLQRGEVEWRGGNLYFDEWDYNFKAQILNKDKAGGKT